MKILRMEAVGIMMFMSLVTVAQKTISEGTITYNIVIQSKLNGNVNSGLNGANTTIYLKGVQSRTDMASSLGNETIIHNAKIGNAVILKEYSGQKLMITLTKENWDARNKKFDGINFEDMHESKIIEGYNCKRAIAKLNDGSTISVYYSPDIIAMNKEYSQAFNNLPGFPMEYEFETTKLIFKYLITNIDFNTVPISKFDLPKSGYRIMTYDENKKGKTEE